MQTRTLSRRRLVQGSGGLVITFSLAAAFRGGNAFAQATTASGSPGLTQTALAQMTQTEPARDVTGDTVDSWLEIDRDGNVTAYSGKVELGTGIQTALSQIVAEELDVSFDRVTMIQGDTALTPNQGTTAGSNSILQAGPVFRQAAAEARLVLLTRASEHLNVPADDLEINDGVISAIGDPDSAVPYGELVSAPFNGEATGDAPTKSTSDYTIVGQSVQRVDIPAKLFGGEAYVQDVRLNGMLHGRVVRPYLQTMNGVSATIEQFDDSEAREMPGVVAVVRKDNFVGVVAEREEEAIRAAEAIHVTWSTGESLAANDQIYDLLREMPSQADELIHNGEVEGALASAAQTVEATYNFASQAHAMMGPACAVADVHEDSATFYSQTQAIYALRAAIADLLGMEEDQVRGIYREGAGCYGHSGADDATADAALLSQAVGRPVRVQWMREDEFGWEPKGPAMTMDVRGGLDDEGNIIAWDYEAWTPPHGTRPGGQVARLLARQLLEPPAEPVSGGFGGGYRNAPHLYSFPNNRITGHGVETPPLRPSSLRSLGGLANTTANENFIDELAAAASADPVEFRLRHLYDPRAIDVIQRAADVAGWETRPAGPAARGTSPIGSDPVTGQGFAFARYKLDSGYVAIVAEVEVDPRSGEVRVTRIVASHDCGLIINPDGLENQIEGNVIQGVSRALKEEVTWSDHEVTSLDWSSYHILTLSETPDIEIALIDRPDEPSVGAGEPAICPTVPAISNAIFDATGARVRTAPYTPELVLSALEAVAI